MPAQTFADALSPEQIKFTVLIVGMMTRIGCAVRQDVVLICLLGVGVGTDLFFLMTMMMTTGNRISSLV